MNVPDFLTNNYWNQIARSHLPELIMVLTVVVVTLMDRYVRNMVNKFASSHGRLVRFFAFVLVCSFGYAFLTLGTAWLLQKGLAVHGGAYMALAAAGIVLVAAVDAQRQRQT